MIDHLAKQPGASRHDGRERCQQPRQKAQGLFIDLGGSLEHCNHKADNKAWQHEYRHGDHDQPQGLPEQAENVAKGHSSMPKLEARVPMIITQPSTRTNSIILKGNDMISGDSIIIPMDISTLATTMSMMRNGINSMKPI